MVSVQEAVQEGCIREFSEWRSTATCRNQFELHVRYTMYSLGAAAVHTVRITCLPCSTVATSLGRIMWHDVEREPCRIHELSGDAMYGDELGSMSTSQVFVKNKMPNNDAYPRAYQCWRSSFSATSRLYVQPLPRFSRPCAQSLIRGAGSQPGEKVRTLVRNWAPLQNGPTRATAFVGT
jgi:hypothetical protein